MAPINDTTFYQQLKDLKVLDPKVLDECLKISQTDHLPLADVLYNQDLLTDEQSGQIMADLVNLPFAHLSQKEIPADIIAIIPEIYCRQQQLVAFKKDKTGIHLATSNPENKQAFDFISRKTGLPVVLSFATSRDINNLLDTSPGASGSSFEKDFQKYLAQAESDSSRDHPIIAIVESVLIRAHKNLASDIHFEPQKNQTIIRFRIDGILHDIITVPSAIFPQIITRIKVLANLRTDEHHSAQDGKLQMDIDSDTIDFRVSIIPTIDGEKIVMRLLATKSRQFSLTNLGLENDDRLKVVNAYKKPYGMILSTGPTGSGKTTTLYALLKLLNSRDVNIMTIEDPVEYEIEGINQIQVDPKTNLTFADGLRSIVRQDPNIILVGEIRDEETAGIAVNAAMTGHLVLSSLHTNDAATTIPRLFDMGVEPFLVASSVNVIIAQRLVRTICQSCRISQEVTRQELLDSGLPPALVKKHFAARTGLRIYHGQGCPVCHQTGYNGRLGIFEVMVIDPDLRTAITSRLNASEIIKIAVKNGMKTMLEDGIAKIAKGLTTIEEVLRVTKI